MRYYQVVVNNIPQTCYIIWSLCSQYPIINVFSLDLKFDLIANHCQIHLHVIRSKLNVYLNLGEEVRHPVVYV